MRHAGDGTAGLLTIGFVPAAINGVLPDIVRRYRAAHPDVALRLTERSPDDRIRELHQHRVDAAFLFAPYPGDALHSRCVSVQHLIAALPESHPLARHESVDLRTLADTPLIMPTRHETQGLFSRITALFDRHDIQPTIAQREVWMFHTIIALVAGEVGAAIVPSAITGHRTKGVAYRTLLPPPDPVHLMLTWRRDDISSPLTNFLRLATA